MTSACDTPLLMACIICLLSGICVRATKPSPLSTQPPQSSPLLHTQYNFLGFHFHLVEFLYSNTLCRRKCSYAGVFHLHLTIIFIVCDPVCVCMCV